MSVANLRFCSYEKSTSIYRPNTKKLESLRQMTWLSLIFVVISLEARFSIDLRPIVIFLVIFWWSDKLFFFFIFSCPCRHCNSQQNLSTWTFHKIIFRIFISFFLCHLWLLFGYQCITWPWLILLLFASSRFASEKNIISLFSTTAQKKRRITRKIIICPIITCGYAFISNRWNGCFFLCADGFSLRLRMRVRTENR